MYQIRCLGNPLFSEEKMPVILPEEHHAAWLGEMEDVLDGEIVAVDEDGIPRFQLLQRFQKQPTAPTLYFVFDVLWSNGADIIGKTLMERRAVLETIIKPAAGIQLGNYAEGEGKALFDLTKAKGMEGIVAERKDGLYRPGKRSPDWLKFKSRPQQEFVVGGFTEGKGSRKHLA